MRQTMEPRRPASAPSSSDGKRRDYRSLWFPPTLTRGPGIKDRPSCVAYGQASHRDCRSPKERRSAKSPPLDCISAATRPTSASRVPGRPARRQSFRPPEKRAAHHAGLLDQENVRRNGPVRQVMVGQAFGHNPHRVLQTREGTLPAPRRASPHHSPGGRAPYGLSGRFCF